MVLSLSFVAQRQTSTLFFYDKTEALPCASTYGSPSAAVIREKKKMGQQHLLAGCLAGWLAGGAVVRAHQIRRNANHSLELLLYLAQQQSSPVAVLADGGAAAVERVPSAPADLDARLDVRHVSALRAAVVRINLIEAAGGKARGHRVRVCVGGGREVVGRRARADQRRLAREIACAEDARRGREEARVTSRE